MRENYKVGSCVVSVNLYTQRMTPDRKLISSVALFLFEHHLGLFWFGTCVLPILYSDAYNHTSHMCIQLSQDKSDSIRSNWLKISFPPTHFPATKHSYL